MTLKKGFCYDVHMFVRKIHLECIHAKQDEPAIALYIGLGGINAVDAGRKWCARCLA